MRIIFTLFVCIFCIQSTFSQEIKEDKSYLNSISRDRVLVELNYTGWDTDYQFSNEIFTVDENNDTTFTTNLTDLKQKWFNRGLNLYFMWDIALGDKKSSNFAFAPGLGISMHNVYSNAQMVSFQNDSTTFRSLENVSRRNNKLATAHIEVPLELRFRSNPDKFSRSWKVAAGLRLGMIISKNAKFKGNVLDENGNTITVKTKNLDVKGFSQYRIGPSLRVGYGNVSLVGFVALTDLFEANKGPKINQFSIGITFNSF